MAANTTLSLIESEAKLRCASSGSACSNDNPCCAGKVCIHKPTYGNICGDASLLEFGRCASSGSACSNSNPCCAGTVCKYKQTYGDICQSASLFESEAKPRCASSGSACSNDNPCCAG